MSALPWHTCASTADNRPRERRQLAPCILTQAGATAPIVTIAQFSPVGVQFSLPEKDMSGWAGLMDVSIVIRTEDCFTMVPLGLRRLRHAVLMWNRQ